MAKIIQMRDEGIEAYPITKPECVIDENGKTIKEIVDNEWKLICDRRMEVGERNVEFTTYADGTPLKATEAIVQVLIDAKAESNRQGYVSIHSSTNTTDSLYGAINFESTNASDTSQFLYQVSLKASPLYMVAEVLAGVKVAVAQLHGINGSAGNIVPPQVYEDITYIKLAPNGAIVTPPYIKIYAR